MGRLLRRWAKVIGSLVAVGLVVGTAVGAGVLLGGLVGPSAQTPPTDESSAAPEPSYLHATESATNAEADYGFHFPPDWDVNHDGAVSYVVNPEGDVRVTFGYGSSRLTARGDRLLELLSKSYDNVELLGAGFRELGGVKSLVRRGTATNDEGVELVFVAATVEGSDRNYAVIAFRTLDDTADDLPAMREVINSFEVASTSI